MKTNGPWRVAALALTLFLASAAAMWGMVSVHAEQPHAKAIPRREFEMFQQSIERRLERIENKLDQVLAK